MALKKGVTMGLIVTNIALDPVWFSVTLNLLVGTYYIYQVVKYHRLLVRLRALEIAYKEQEQRATHIAQEAERLRQQAVVMLVCQHATLLREDRFTNVHQT